MPCARACLDRSSSAPTKSRLSVVSSRTRTSMPYGSTEFRPNSAVQLAADRLRMLGGMTMNFEELDVATRDWMMTRFQFEMTSPDPYRSRGLSSVGLGAF